MNPIPAWVRRLWDVWDVRVLIAFSLIIQTILFMLGNRRKYISKIWIQITVWLGYLVADWVATLALGKLSDVDVNVEAKTNNFDLGGIWAPLLLLHLGGPDTITAYSVDDNQLWLRHFLGLFVQLSVAIYVFLMSFSITSSSWFSYLALPVFVAGLIKYGERTWALKSASDPHHTVPFANIKKEVVLRRSAVSSDAQVLSNLLLSSYPQARVFLWANQIVDVYRPHTENYGAPIEDVTARELVLNHIEDGLMYLEAIDVEMGLMYNLLYTKAAITHTKLGCILRSISFSCTVFVFVGFFYLIFMSTSTSTSVMEAMTGHDHIKVDIAITGALLVGAFVLEVYGFILLLSSEWTMLWLITQYPKYQFAAHLFKKFPWLFSKQKQQRRRWSNLMGQFNLLSFALKDKDKKPMKSIRRILRLFRIEETLDNYRHETCEVVPEFLKKNIAKFILSDNWDFTEKSDKEALDHGDSRGIFTRLDFDEKIIIWHIATQVCYHHQDSHTNTDEDQIKETCKIVSDYMVYLLVMCPFILPINKKDDVTVRDAVATLKAFFEETGVSVEDEAYVKLGQQIEAIDNVLIGKAHVLIKKLLDKENGKCWRILSCIWMEIICHAAKESQQNNHVRGLGRGGEFLTWVWLFLTQSVKSGKVEVTEKYVQVWAYQEEFQRWDSYISIFLDDMERQIN